MKSISHPFSLRQLQYALAIEETGGFRRAAVQCAVSQPSLSAQVAQLEGVLSVKLFERSRRGVIVTPEGARLLPRFRSIVGAADDVLDLAAGLVDPLQGPLRLGVIPTLSPYLLPAMADTVPEKLRIEWVEDKTETLVRQLHAGKLDGALLALEAELGAVDHEVVARDPFVLALSPSHPFGRSRSRIEPAALLGLDMLLLDDGHCLRDQALEVCSASREVGFRATSLSTLVPMVARGQGATLLPSLALPVENRRGQLTIRRFRDPAPGRTVAVIWRRGSPREPALRAVAQAARAAARAARREV